MDTTQSQSELWDRHAIAEYLGIATSSVNKWLARNQIRVAGHRPDAGRGTLANLYSASAIRAAKAAMPGKGNRTARKK